jgi:hypothetical protein
MLQFIITAVREGNRGSVERLSDWSLPVAGNLGGSLPDSDGDSWFYSTLATPISYTMPTGVGVGGGPAAVPVTDVVLRPHYLDEQPSPDMRGFLMDFAVVLDPVMRDSGVIDLNRVDFIAVVEVDAVREGEEAPVSPAAPTPEPEEIAEIVQVDDPVDHQESEPEAAIEDVTNAVGGISSAEEMQPDQLGHTSDEPSEMSDIDPEELSDFEPEDTTDEELVQVELPPTVPQMEFPAAVPQVELPPTVSQMEFPPTAAQVELPPTVPQMEFSPAVSHDELPPTVPQMEFPPTDQKVERPVVARPVVDRPRPVRDEVVFDTLPEREPRNTGPLKLAAAAAAGLVLVGFGISALFSRNGDATAAQIESTTETTTAAMSTPTPPAPAPLSPEELARVVRELPAGYTPESCTPKEGVEAGGVGTLACGPNTDPGGPLSGIYTVFRDRTSLNEAFDRAVYASTQRVCPGNMQSPGPWRRNAAPEREAGVLFCGTRGETPVVIWSDIEKLRLSTVLGSPGGPNLDALYGWWTQHS